MFCFIPCFYNLKILNSLSASFYPRMITNKFSGVILKMEFTRQPESSSAKKIHTISSLNEKYPLDLTMYTEIPTDQVDIEEFQEMAVERVRLLRVLETASLKSSKDMSFRDIVEDEMKKQNMKYFLPIVKNYADAEIRRRDYLSHFILRLCYCRSEELKKWFLARELEFFKLKFFNMTKKEDILFFMKKNNLNYTPISDEEKRAIALDLYNSTGRNINLDLTQIYKVYFTQTLDLVRSRKVFIKSGYAYIPQMDLISIFTSLFRIRLSRALAICAGNISKFENDERLLKVLTGLHMSYTGNDYCIKTRDNLSRNDLDALSVKSFPPCMRAMHETFKHTHHLRYFGRLQFGLFLKGIGLSLEESLKFWKEGFTKKADLDGDAFEKRYAYNIRHSYGTEGKRANYAPHNCMKIINTSVGPGDNHGCPFKHYDSNFLKQMLQKYNLSVIDISTITDYAGRGHYQLACTKYFEATHSVTNAKGINHPNLYFEESQNIINGKEVEKISGKTSKLETLKVNNVQKEQKNIEWTDETAFDLNVEDITKNIENY